MSAVISHLIVEPDDGVEPVRDLISSAEKSLLIKQFTFSEPTLLQAVTDRKNAGVEVRVMLNPKRSGGDRANDDTYDYFKKNGVSVQWANPKFYVTHEKSIVGGRENRSDCHLQPLSEVFYSNARLRSGDARSDPSRTDH